MNANIQTRTLIYRFMKVYLLERGHELPWPHIDKNPESQPNWTRELDEVLEVLLKLTDELREHIHATREQVFQEKLNEIFNNYEEFKYMADELFSQRYSWSHIVTLLLYGAECAYKAIELPKTKRKKSHQMVFKLTQWICQYFDDFLENWIFSQPDGWFDLKRFLEEKQQNGGSTTGENNQQPQKVASQKGRRHYFGMVAVVVGFVGSLYLCSKFTVLK